MVYTRLSAAFNAPDVWQFITFRLADSLPNEVLKRLREEKNFKSDSHKRKYIESQLDRGYGNCYLKDSQIAKQVEEELLYFHKERYDFIAWVIMPNHVHVFIKVLDYPLSEIIKSWRSYSGKKANKLLDRSGPFWMRDYFDRCIRNEKHFYQAINYIHMNPVKANLVEQVTDWQFSSAKYCQ